MLSLPFFSYAGPQLQDVCWSCARPFRVHTASIYETLIIVYHEFDDENGEPTLWWTEVRAVYSALLNIGRLCEVRK